MNRNNLVLIPLAIPFLIVDVALVVRSAVPMQTALTCLGVFAAVIFLFWFFRIRGQGIEKDKRTIRLSRKALAYSWMVTLYVVALLMGSDTLGLIRLSGVQCLTVVLMVMTLSYFVMSLVVNRKGDAE